MIVTEIIMKLNIVKTIIMSYNDDIFVYNPEHPPPPQVFPPNVNFTDQKYAFPFGSLGKISTVIGFFH